MRKIAIIFPCPITSSGVENSEYRSYIACSNGLHPLVYAIASSKGKTKYQSNVCT